jgi:hypothetical protein
MLLRRRTTRGIAVRETKLTTLPPRNFERFDYAAPAGVFTRFGRGRLGGGARYRRFPSAAEAIRYVMEELPPPLWPGISLESGDDTLDHRQISELYTSDNYPLQRSPR